MTTLVLNSLKTLLGIAIVLFVLDFCLEPWRYSKDVYVNVSVPDDVESIKVESDMDFSNPHMGMTAPSFEISDHSQIKRILSVLNLFSRRWFAADAYPDFNHPITLSFKAKNQKLPQVMAGLGGLAIYGQIITKRYTLLYNVGFDSPKFPSSESQVYSRFCPYLKNAKVRLDCASYDIVAVSERFGRKLGRP